MKDGVRTTPISAIIMPVSCVQVFRQGVLFSIAPWLAKLAGTYNDVTYIA